MYVLRDIKVKFEDLTAQIDYVIITPVYTYYVECKNLVGNITVNEKGDFIREFTVNGKKIKRGMYSPLRQVEAQREVIRKIWELNSSKIEKLFASKNFNYYRRVLVVAANQDTILDTKRAPKEIKHQIIRADNLIRQIEYDLNHRSNDEYIESKKSMEKIAKSYMNISTKESVDYYEYYKNIFCKEDHFVSDEMADKLIAFRKKRASKMKIPAYYVFTNVELSKIVEIKPKTIEQLKQANILSDIKIKKHGKSIINVINEYYN